MATFTKESADALDAAAKAVGAYLGWADRMIGKLKKDIKEAPLGFWKRRAANAAVRKLEKALTKEERDFTALIEELGKLGGVLEETKFIEHCESVRRTVMPLFARVQLYYNEVNKIIAVVRFATKKEA